MFSKEISHLASFYMILFMISLKSKDFPTHAFYADKNFVFIASLGNLRSILCNSYMFIVLFRARVDKLL